jgi:activator of 2-hydroxyglutaryl-CoA dehydratase
MAQRLINLINRIGMEEDFAITGGIAKNAGIVTRLKREFGVEPLTSEYDAQSAGAIGAALIAHDLLLKQKDEG